MEFELYTTQQHDSSQESESRSVRRYIHVWVLKTRVPDDVSDDVRVTTRQRHADSK